MENSAPNDGAPNDGAAFLKRDPLELQLYSALKTAQQRVRDWPGNLPVPVLCAVGMQSAGKTTFIEALVGFRVGTTCAGTGTRCPVRYILKDGEPSFSVNGARLAERGDIQVAVERYMEGLALKPRESERFSKEELKVEITDRSLPLLDITDLPGLKAKGEGAEEIRAIVRSHVQSQSARPVVLVKATESVETQADVELLRDVGIDPKKGNAVFVVNYFNDQLYKFSRASELNEYCKGYVDEYGDVFFCMLIYSQEAKDAKDRLDFEGQCSYYRQLPKEEEKTFRQKLATMEKDVEVQNDDVIRRFGVAPAISKMQSILREFVVREGRKYSDKLRPLEDAMDERLRSVQRELRKCNPEYIKEQRERYVEKWGEVVRDFQRCKKRLDSESDFNPMDSGMTFFEELVEVHELNGRKTLLGQREGNTRKEWEDAATTMRKQASSRGHPPDLGKFADASLRAKLTADASLVRLNDAFDFVIDTQIGIQRVQEDEARAISGYAPGDMPGAFDHLQVIKEVATRPLAEVKEKILPMLKHVEAIYGRAPIFSHAALREHPGCTEALESSITQSYTKFMRKKIAEAREHFEAIIIEKTSYMTVEFPERCALFGAPQQGPDLRGLLGAACSPLALLLMGAREWCSDRRRAKPWLVGLAAGFAALPGLVFFMAKPSQQEVTPDMNALNSKAAQHCQRLKKELCEQFRSRFARGLFDYFNRSILVDVRDDLRQQIHDVDARRIDEDTRMHAAELRLTETEHKESLCYIRQVLNSIDDLEKSFAANYTPRPGGAASD